MGMKKTAAADNYWADFVSATSIVDDGYTVVVLGEGAAMAAELAGLVVSGRKRATASLRRDYGAGKDPLPQPGDFVMVVDSGGRPSCIWRTTEIVVKSLIACDDAFAWDEGEGDRSRDWWLSAHRAYFSAQARREGFAMSDTIETVFERFEVVWPPGIDELTI